jgi:hypothetical protein
MRNPTYEIIDNIFEDDEELELLKRENSRNQVHSSIHIPPTSSNITPSYDEEKMRRKMNAPISARDAMQRQYNSMYNSFTSGNRLLIPPHPVVNNPIIQPGSYQSDILLDGNSKAKVQQAPIITHHDVRCKDLYEHMENCPMCSKFYNSNNDRFYIILLIGMALVILYLLKFKNPQ